MTVSHRKARSAGGAYYINGLVNSVEEGAEAPGGLAAEWLVSGPTAHTTQELLGLACGGWRGSSDVNMFQSLAQGLLPQVQEGDQHRRLVQNAGSPKRVGLHDFTLSAPKSVSVVWAFADRRTRRQIEEAQARAARAFVVLLGQQAAYSRQGSAGHIKTGCAVVSALFPHFTSRSDDPQLHTHCVFLNLAVRPDGSTGGLETLGMMRLLGVAACAYHGVLAEGLEAIGFHIESRGQLFEVEGVPAAVRLAFSQRRVAALAAVQERAHWQAPEVPRKAPSPRQMMMAVLSTRVKKRALSGAELTSLWLRRGRSLGFGPADVLAARWRCSPPSVCVDAIADGPPESVLRPRFAPP